MSTLTEAEPGEAGGGGARRRGLDAFLRRCCWGLALALAALVAVALALWLGGRRWAPTFAAVELGDVRVDRPPGAPGPLVGHARLRLTNRTPFRFQLRGMRYRVEASGREIARGLWSPDAPVELPAGGHTEIEVRADLDVTRLAGAALAVLGGNGGTARLEAEVDARWLFGSVTVPLAVERPLPLHPPPLARAGGR